MKKWKHVCNVFLLDQKDGVEFSSGKTQQYFLEWRQCYSYKSYILNSHFFVGVTSEAWEGKYSFMSKRLGVEWVMLCK